MKATDLTTRRTLTGYGHSGLLFFDGGPAGQFDPRIRSGYQAPNLRRYRMKATTNAAISSAPVSNAK